ncbi:MAG: hypothetical protein JNJ70_09775 [Verrucomicrobiales bacterium]|nr:hypothetical protein [Verrucomicrobiales bacterium]
MPGTFGKNLDILAVSLLEEFGETLRRQIVRSADELRWGRFDRLLSPLAKAQMRHGIEQTECDHLFVLLVDPSGDGVRPVYHLPAGTADGVVIDPEQGGAAVQGVLAMTCASGQAVCDFDVAGNPFWSGELDGLSGATTRDLIAVPLRFATRLRGVVAFLRTEERQRGMAANAHHFRTACLVVSTLEPLIDLHLASTILKWE